MAAADQENESNAWHDSHSIREGACGSVFASTVIKSLTSTNGVAMQPEDPNDNQVVTFNAYTRSIIDICRSDVTRFWDKQNFTFSAQDDEWEGVWHERTGIPLGIPPGHFKDRWNQLVDVPYARDSTKKLYLDPHPSNTGKTVTAQPGPTGGVLCSANPWETMTRAMITGDVRKMAQLFLETCPGDWNRGWGVGLSTMLTDAVKHGIEPKKRRVRRYIDIAAFIMYRWQLAEMADSFVQEHKLRKPNDETCIFWNNFDWSAPAHQTIPGYGDRFGLAYSHLVHEGFNPEPMRYQGPHFNRFTRHMAAAIALTDLPQEENHRVLQSLVCRMDKYKEFNKKICVEDKGVLQREREWHEAIGR
ncbi:hypothetical protein CORC01_12599 [Colletotrichum orchidophilum]|uniref:Uncharacterized protein n=1 Tax=Colletotrichum orchidophilum TaxID=1209926 RepID=A0A1G4ASE1_9PEZI|nr:uncharacterized protein CORC01_12599 [Colletotrichum orchidophilum]OHE92084.1 hypothetical protein CORC01_12599 [Colletotrichum orchidophilum]